MASNKRLKRICEQCRLPFIAQTSATLYCSKKCSSRAAKIRQRKLVDRLSDTETIQKLGENQQMLRNHVTLSITQVCWYLGISRRTVYRLMDKGELLYTKLGRRTIFLQEDIQALFHKRSPIVRDLRNAEDTTADPKIPTSHGD